MRRSDGKKRAALFLAVLLCTACLGCMHVRAYISEGEPKLDRILGDTAPSGSEATDAKQGDWQQAYQSFIRSEAYLSFPGAAFGDNKGCIQFALHDFERDGVPELLIGNGYDAHLSSGANVFAFRNGGIRYLGEVSSDAGGAGLCSRDDSYYTGLFWTEVFQGSRGTVYYYIDGNGELARESVESGEFEDPENSSGEYRLLSRTDDDRLFNLAQDQEATELETFDHDTMERTDWNDFVLCYQNAWSDTDQWQTTEQPHETGHQDAPAPALEAWQQLYMDLIESGSYTQWLEINDASFDGQWFALHDMDGDGTPELVFNDGGEWHQYYSQVCTIKNGSVQYLGRLRAPLGFPRGENGEQQFFYHYYETAEYPGLFVEIPIAGYYENISDNYFGYFHVTPEGQITEDVVEASASGSILKRTSDEGLYRLIKSAEVIPLRFIEREDLLGGEWDRLWATWTGVPANTTGPVTEADTKAPDPGDRDLWGAVDRSGILDNIYRTYAEIDAATGELESVEVEYEIGLFHYIYCFRGSSIFYSFETDLSPIEYDTETGSLSRSQVAPYIRQTDRCDGVSVNKLSQLGFNGTVNAKDFCDEFLDDERYEDLWVAFTTHNGYRVEFLCDDSRGTISGNSPVWFKTDLPEQPKDTGTQAQSTEAGTPDAAEGGFHGDKDGFGGFFADQNGYRIPLGFGDRYDMDEVFAVSKTWEIVSNTPDVEGYGFFDVDRDGRKELIMKIGTCEADYTYTFYRYDDYEGTFCWIGTVGASHSELYTDGSSLIRDNAHMGSQTISRIEYIGGQMKETKIADYEVLEGDYVDMGYEPVYLCTRNIYLDYLP